MEPINKDLSSNIISHNNESNNIENDFNDKSNNLKLKDKIKNLLKESSQAQPLKLRK